MAVPATLLRAARFDGGRLVLELGNGLGAIVDGGAPLDEFCQQAALSPAVVNRIEVIFEEVIANIVRHGFAPGSDQSIRVEVGRADDDVVLVFEDDGVAFDPTSHAAPAPFTQLKDAPIGGLGISLVRQLGRSVVYARPAAGDGDFRPVNRLTVRVAAGPRMPAGQ